MRKLKAYLRPSLTTCCRNLFERTDEKRRRIRASDSFQFSAQFKLTAILKRNIHLTYPRIGLRSATMMGAFLKLDSLRYLLPFCIFQYFRFFRVKSSCVRVPVVFYLNMSKKGKKQDVNDDSFESYVKDCLETIRQNVGLLLGVTVHEFMLISICQCLCHLMIVSCSHVFIGLVVS